MNLVDTNGVSDIIGRYVVLENDYFLAPDIVEEVELTQLVHNRRLPGRVFEIANTPEFDEVSYLAHYKRVLNEYGDRSFFNMTGFGDVSILATLYMMAEVFARQRNLQLFDMSESITVFTDDKPLTREIGRAFQNTGVSVQPCDQIM